MLPPFHLRFFFLFPLSIPFVRPVVSLSSSHLPPRPFFFACKTRSSTSPYHSLSFPPLSTATCRFRPWLVPKVSVISTIRLVLLRRLFSLTFSSFLLPPPYLAPSLLRGWVCRHQISSPLVVFLRF